MFGKNLKSSRKKLGLTLDNLAEKYNERFDAKLSKGTLSKYENGKQEPMISVVANLATLLGVSADYLLDGKSPTVKNENIEKYDFVINKLPIIKKYIKLTIDDKQKVDTYIDDLLATSKYQNSTSRLHKSLNNTVNTIEEGCEIAAWGAEGTEGTFETPEEEIT